MKAFLPLSLTAILLLAACSQKPAEGIDLTVALGERVGEIKANTTRDKLAELYGAENVVDNEYPIGEGEMVPAAIIFPGTSREATVIWAPDKKNEKVDRVVVTGEEWLLPAGIRPGDELAEVEQINGAPFMIYGFGWDYGGVGYFKGGQLDRKVQIWFRPAIEEGPDYEKVLGDSLFNSADQAMRTVDPRITEVAIVLGAKSQD
jgi:hypothetical protein